jgi:hypothetical protein
VPNTLGIRNIRKHVLCHVSVLKLSMANILSLEYLRSLEHGYQLLLGAYRAL